MTLGLSKNEPNHSSSRTMGGKMFYETTAQILLQAIADFYKDERTRMKRRITSKTIRSSHVFHLLRAWRTQLVIPKA